MPPSRSTSTWLALRVSRRRTPSDPAPEPVQWQPVLLGGLFKLTGRSSWALGDYRRRESGMAEIERRTRTYRLPPMRWPDPWPGDYLQAMRGAPSRSRPVPVASLRCAPSATRSRRAPTWRSWAASSRRRHRRGSTAQRRSARFGIRTSRRRCGRYRCRVRGRVFGVPRSRSARSCSGAMTGSRMRPRISATCWRRDGRAVRSHGAPGADRASPDGRWPVDPGARGRGVRGRRTRVRGRGLQARRRRARGHRRRARPDPGSVRRQRLRPLAGADPRGHVQDYLARLAPEAERQGVALGEPRYDDDDWESKLELVWNERIPVVSFVFGCPTPGVAERLHSHGVAVWVTVTRVEEALEAQRAGADALVVQGTEAGGHRASFIDDEDAAGSGLLALLRVVAAAVPLPLIQPAGSPTARRSPRLSARARRWGRSARRSCWLPKPEPIRLSGRSWPTGSRPAHARLHGADGPGDGEPLHARAQRARPRRLSGD